MQVFRTCFSKPLFQLISCKPQKILHSPEAAEISAEKPSHNNHRRNRRQHHPYRIPDPFPRNRPLINCGNNRPNRRKLRLKQARDQQERKDLNHCFRPVSFVLFFQICSSFLMFNVSSPLPDHSIYVPGLIHKSPKDSLPGNLRGRYPSGHLLHFRWILPVTVKNPHKSCIFCTFMRVLYFCVIFTNSQLNYAFICFAKFYFSSYFLNLAFLLKLRLFPFFQSAFKLFPKIFRPNFLSRRLSLQYSNHIIVLKRLIIVPIF